VVCRPEIYDFIYNLWWGTQTGVLGARLAIDQAGFSLFCQRPFPTIVGLASYSKMPARLGDVADLLCIFQYPQLPLDIPLGLGHGTTSVLEDNYLSIIVTRSRKSQKA
jgi:hypothetical protein